MIDIFLDITPKPQKAVQKGRMGFYDPCAAYKRTLKTLIKKALWAYDFDPKDWPAVDVAFIFYFKKRASWTKKKKENPGPHNIRPDRDNLEKAISDAGNGILWADDCQIVSSYSLKLWSDFNGIRIVVTPIQDISPKIGGLRPAFFCS